MSIFIFFVGTEGQSKNGLRPGFLPPPVHERHSPPDFSKRPESPDNRQRRVSTNFSDFAVY